MPVRISVMFLLLQALATAAEPQALLSGKQPLGRSSQPEWREFANDLNVRENLELPFTLKGDGPHSLFIQQRDVKYDWKLELNGKTLGRLFLMEDELVQGYDIPPALLKPDTNILRILPPREIDDIEVGAIQVRPGRLVDILGGATLQVTVLTSTGLLPARLTIVRADGVLAPILQETNDVQLAIRPGVVYTGSGRATVHLEPGAYTIYATRGLEYGLAKQDVVLRPGGNANVSLHLDREVATPGWASMDTHVHTWTYSRHGDATVEERMATLAGEGIEAPVAADHNLIIDYDTILTKTGGRKWFTPILGDEVTTSRGHFNAFPFLTNSTPPSAAVTNWVELLGNIRSNQSVKVVVLNHPRDLHSNFRPFAATNFNALTGENLRGYPFTFDAMEIVNSGALRSDWREAFRDWFALLNHGLSIVGVGGSDSHDVSRFIVGQGRTYVRCSDSNPAGLNVSEIADNLHQGRALVSFGLLVDARVHGRFGVGDLATNLPDQISIMIDLQGPSWSHADTLELFANGQLVRKLDIKDQRGPQRLKQNWKVKRPRHDEFWVFVASGPGVKQPYWRVPHPYQAESLDWTPRTLAATNPIRIDGDGDSEYSSPKQYADTILAKHSDAAEAWRAVADYDEPTAIQFIAAWKAAGRSMPDLQKSAPVTRQGILAAVLKGYAN